MLYKQNILLGALMIIAAEFMMTIAGACIKTISTGLPNEMIVFLRNLFGLILLLPFISRYGLAELKTKVSHLHLLRAIIGVSAMYCFFYALGRLPLAEGMILKMTTPIFIPIIAYLWLSEKASPYALLAIPIGFIGVWLVIDPGGDISTASLFGLLGGLLAAGVKTSIRRLSKTEPTIRIVFYFAVLATLISSIPLLWAWQTPNTQQWLLLIAIAGTATTGQTLMTRGYAIAPLSSIAPFTYTSVIFAGVYGYFIWGETLNSLFILGSILIAIAGLITVYGGHLISKKALAQQDETL